MIYTVTLNPAVDYIIHVDNINFGSVNRSTREDIFYGGKGINVSLVLAELGIPSKALGFVAGFTGQAIEDYVKQHGIETDFIHLDSGNSRINVKIRSDCETEINGQGPKISANKTEELLKKIDSLKDGDVLVLAGSVSPSLQYDIYGKILAHIEGKNIKAVVDTSKELLLNTLKYKPFLIKPNNIELGEIFGIFADSEEDIIKYAKKLKEKGAQNVLVSRAKNGSILLDENENIHICGVCHGTVKNSVGSGDSMVAGFIAGYETNDYDYALKLGTACGGATAFSDGLAKKDDVFRLLKSTSKTLF